MNPDIQPDTTDSVARRTELIIGLAVVLVIVGIIVGIVLVVSNTNPRIVYEPAKACQLLKLDEAGSLLGGSVQKSGVTDVVVKGDLATSKCGYTDGNPSEDEVIVAAIIVRSGINDKGIAQNKSEFAAGKPTTDVEDVTDLGDSAYFNKAKGQLNILNGKDWIILSYGVASEPKENSLDDAILIGRSVVDAPGVKF